VRLLRILVLVLAASACDDRSYREIGGAIDVLIKKNNDLPGPAIERLRQIGRRAVPQIETAMHTASARGKVNLVSALAAIGEPESASILQHFAVYDGNPEVRTACEKVLAQWAAGNDRLAPPAKQAIARIQEKRRLGPAE
jgi:HEAT repeat protein